MGEQNPTKTVYSYRLTFSEEAKKSVPNTTSHQITLTEEEAFKILTMCLLSPVKDDLIAERALKKLAEFCKSAQYYERDKERKVSHG
ncbi:MAG: hypothetical protein U0R49_03115 [Fimbriimonadales bacterium]